MPCEIRQRIFDEMDLFFATTGDADFDQLVEYANEVRPFDPWLATAFVYMQVHRRRAGGWEKAPNAPRYRPDRFWAMADGGRDWGHKLPPEIFDALDEDTMFGTQKCFNNTGRSTEALARALELIGYNEVII